MEKFLLIVVLIIVALSYRELRKIKRWVVKTDEEKQRIYQLYKNDQEEKETFFYGLYKNITNEKEKEKFLNKYLKSIDKLWKEREKL